jgi:hypothetical protein
MLEWFLSKDDAGRAERAVQKLLQHDISSWVLTGGLAVEIHHTLRGHESFMRRLNDIDFITESFEDLPESLARDYLFRHIHPFDPPGKTILQAIEPDEALRIDVFRAYGASIDRAREVQFANATVRLIAVEDLMARTARLVMDLAGGVPVPEKHGRDFLRLIKFVDAVAVETVWQEHRKPNHPTSFAEVRELLQEMILIRQDLLITPQYSTDVAEVCPRCKPTSTFQLAHPQSTLSLLGYC